MNIQFLLSYSRLSDRSVIPSACIYGRGVHDQADDCLALFGTKVVGVTHFRYVRLPGREELFKPPPEYRIGTLDFGLEVAFQSQNLLCATMADFAVGCSLFSELLVTQLNRWFFGVGDARFAKEDDQWESDSNRIHEEWCTSIPELIDRACSINPLTRTYVEREWYDSLTTIEYDLTL